MNAASGKNAVFTPFMKFAARCSLARCRILTVLVLFYLVASALFSGKNFRIPNGLLHAVFYAAMLFAPYFLTRKRGTLKLAVFIAVPCLLPDLINKCFLHYEAALDTWPMLFFLLVTVFEVVLVFVTVRYSVRAENREPVFGCILAYLLLGIVFGRFFFLLETAVSGSFSIPHPPVEIDFLYFSFVALTTCGFGDIVPVSPLAKILVSLECVIGVLYIAIVVGFLVSTYSRTLARRIHD